MGQSRSRVRIALLGLGILLGLLLIVPLVIPIPPLENTHPPETLADPDSRFLEVAGVRLHYKTAGETAPAFVLLHGFAASLYSWRNVVTPLARAGTVVAFDRPAFGLTERPLPGQWNGESPYSSRYQVTLTLGLMDALGLERAILVGNSAGGTLATLTALEHPERVQALILIDPAIHDQEWNPLWEWAADLPQAQRLGPFAMRRIRTWGDDFARSAWHNPELITPEEWEGFRRPLQAENWDRGLWEMTRAVTALDLVSQLPRLDLPVLIITGDDDRIIPTARHIQLADEIPGAQLVVIPNCGHVPHEECPEPVLNAIAAFVQDLPR